LTIYVNVSNVYTETQSTNEIYVHTCCEAVFLVDKRHVCAICKERFMAVMSGAMYIYGGEVLAKRVGKMAVDYVLLYN
jgi:hypothetical protein